MEILTTSWVVPVSGPPLRDGRVAVRDGRIVWVGTVHGAGAPEAPVRDLGPGVLLPGLVNAHCHLELSHLAGLSARTRGFVDWVEAVVQAHASETSSVVEEATRQAVDLLDGETATAAVADVSNQLAHIELLHGARFRTLVLHELIGWDPDKADEVAMRARARMSEVSKGERSSQVRMRLAAHAPHSVSRRLFEALIAEGGPAGLHLAESPEETRFLERGDGEWKAFLDRRGLGHVAFEPPGSSPVSYVDSLGALRAGLLAAHCVQVDAEDRRLLAARGVHVAICLTSNRNLGVGIPPVPEMLDAGIRLCVGTDSLASGDSLDVMSEVVAMSRQFPSLDPGALIRMATLGGAEALGFDDLGTLAPGKAAAMAFAAAETPPKDPCAFLVSEDARVRRVQS